MKKTISAFLAVALITLLLAGSMFLVGQDAQAASATAQAAISAGDQSAMIQALQTQLAQYQALEQQYQQQLTQAADRINSDNQQIAQANQQLAQYQSLLTQLQENGLITMNSDGTVGIVTQQSGVPGWFQGEHH